MPPDNSVVGQEESGWGQLCDRIGRELVTAEAGDGHTGFILRFSVVSICFQISQNKDLVSFFK